MVGKYPIFLETLKRKIDMMIETIKAEIERLTEYKQRLIPDVVTGQINIKKEQV